MFIRQGFVIHTKDTNKTQIWQYAAMHIRYLFQQNSLRLRNSCKNYKGMANIFYTATDDMSKVLNIEVPFRAKRLLFAYIA